MEEAIKEYTPSGKIKRPSYSLVAGWVKEAWDNIDSSMIRRSFKCCGISTNTDGSEDESIFDFEKVSGRRRSIVEEVESEGEDEDKSEEDYYENEEDTYVNVWE